MTGKPKILVIVGPTASGKSDLAVLLAKKFDGEVVSADSRQVYRGLNIGSGKVTKREMAGVPHHLLDIANPKRVYSVAQYQMAAQKAIADILTRGKLPIICGGTGQYVQSIVDGLALPKVAPDWKLRRELEKLSNAELFARLQKLDPARAKSIDAHNPRRLIRAIEIATKLGQVPALHKSEKYDALQIGLKIDLISLKSKIETRLHKRLKQGMVAEVKKLHEDGPSHTIASGRGRSKLSWKRLEDLGLEYRYLARFLQSKITRAEMVAQLSAEIVRYAKRQMTWFKKDQRIIWISRPFEAEKLVKKFLNR